MPRTTVDDDDEEDFHIDSEVRCEGAHPLCGALSRRGLNPIIKLAYTIHIGRMVGPIAASAFNRLGQYASSSPGNRDGLLLCRTRRFFYIA